MKLLILQLGDIHLKSSTDVVLSRVPKIVDAVKNLDPDLQAVVCTLVGDITYSGKEHEFQAAFDMVIQLRELLSQNVPPSCPIYVVTVPGNHDLDLDEATAARGLVIQEIQKNPDRMLDPSFADLCVAPQRRFFQFRDCLDTPPVSGNEKQDARLYCEYEINLGEHQVLLCCCNTSALSKLHEKPGELVLPPSVLPSQRKQATVSVGILHHPTNWLSEQCRRSFRSRLEKITDFILTGHEHVLDKRHTQTDKSENLYLEGGVLQESGNPAVSAFFAITLDVSAKKRRIIAFSWTGEAYEASNCEDPQQYNLWDDLALNRFRLDDAFSITSDFRKLLDDPGMALVHKTRGQLKLSDIYVFPDLKRINVGGERGTKTVMAPKVVEFVCEQPCLFIVGDDSSGKTALAKSLFDELRNKSDVPVFFDALKDRLTISGCETQIEDAVVRIYGRDALTDYRQINRAKRVIIIDNYHKLRLPDRGRVELLRRLRTHAFRLVIFAHDLEMTFQDFSESADTLSGELPFAYYQILPFSLLRQNALVEKWLLLGEESDADAVKFVQTLDRIMQLLRAIIGKNYVPPFPPYLLAVLQAVETGTEIDVTASTHGYFYELFIKSAIARKTTHVGFNVLNVFLSHLANWMFVHHAKQITILDVTALHASLHERVEVLPNCEKLMEQLLDMNLLSLVNDHYAFRHPYIFYYFIALFFRDKLSDPEFIAQVTDLANGIHKEKNANILLFLSHLSKKREIVKILIRAAKKQYTDTVEANLDSDVSFLNEMNQSVGHLKLPAIGTNEAREMALNSMEESKIQEDDFELQHKQEIESGESFLGKLNAALKTIQILGQFLKNFPADLDRSEKDEIIATACSLGRKLLGNFISLIRTNENDILQEMLFLIGRHKPDMEPDELREQAVRTVGTLCELASSGIITRLSYSLGSRDLSATYDRYFPESAAPIMHLIYTALNLDHYDRFPEALVRAEATKLHKNPLAFRVLRSLVARYLIMYPTDFRLRQSMSEVLKLEYKQVSIRRPEQRLL